MWNGIGAKSILVLHVRFGELKPPPPPQFVYWHHNGTLLKDGKYPENSPNDGGLISTHMTHTSSRAMSMLTLHNIQHFHSGNYTCSAPNAQSDTTHLFVTQR